jgi:hypothetical protein
MRYEGIKGHTLDINAAGICTEKQSETMTYKGSKCSTPMVGDIAENGLFLGDEFREGIALAIWSDLTTVFQTLVCTSTVDAVLFCSIKHGLDIFQPGVI